MTYHEIKPAIAVGWWGRGRVMVHAVGTKCMTEGLVYLPIHDGFLTLPDQFDRVCEIVAEAYLVEAGSIPRIRRK